MSWPQFHFKCRFFTQYLQQGRTIAEAEQQYQNSGLSTLHSNHQLEPAQQSLFERAAVVSNKQVSAGLKVEHSALAYYAGLDLEQKLKASKKYESILNKLYYMVSLALIYIALSSVHKVFVHPVFSEFIAQYPRLNNPYFEAFNMVWMVGLIVSASIIAFSFMISVLIKNMDKIIIQGATQWQKSILPKSILLEVNELNNIITLPIKDESLDSELYKKIHTISELGLDKNIELFSLFNKHTERLEQKVWQMISRMQLLLAPILFCSIAFYIINIYIPIFSIGEVMS
ncbi:hypothetical protein [Flocculibacter collagenilyticus]|uniref:hypothetical protein n=1 Tax=Flocculibacter collagenilyticus TaxID=2744479 RepID=UPI0018F67045|nr:hypothetical protein [Flocculibacter collagenilyticus]